MRILRRLRWRRRVRFFDHFQRKRDCAAGTAGERGRRRRRRGVGYLSLVPAGDGSLFSFLTYRRLLVAGVALGAPLDVEEQRNLSAVHESEVLQALVLLVERLLREL